MNVFPDWIAWAFWAVVIVGCLSAAAVLAWVL